MQSIIYRRLAHDNAPALIRLSSAAAATAAAAAAAAMGASLIAA